MIKDDEYQKYLIDLKEKAKSSYLLRESILDAEYNGYLECIHMTLHSLFKHKCEYFVFGSLNRREKVPIKSAEFFAEK